MELFLRPNASARGSSFFVILRTLGRKIKASNQERRRTIKKFRSLTPDIPPFVQKDQVRWVRGFGKYSGFDESWVSGSWHTDKLVW